MPPSTADGPRKPLRYRPRSPRPRARRQVEPEAEEDFTSGSEDEFESDSDGEDEPLPPLPTETSGSAVTTFKVDKGGVIATTLPDGSVDVEPPVNAVLPGTETGVGSTTEALADMASEATASASASVEAMYETTVSASRTESASASASSGVDKEFNRDGHDEGHPEEMMKEDDTKRHVMIGAGSIGAFVGVCILAWLFWRFTRAKKQSGRDGSPWPRLFPGGRPKFSRQAQAGRLLGRIPWVRSQPWALRWQTLGDEDAVPIREKTDRSSVLSGRSQDEKVETARAVSLQRVVVPPLDTGFDFGLPVQHASQHVASPEASATVSPVSAATTVPPTAATHQQGTFDSLDNQGGTWVYLSPTAPPQRNRASELSSLSSGFGDGDIVVPPARALNRDTVYTATSEDQPARFRTVSSWVDQQKGRIHRAQERVRDGRAVVVPGGEEGVPPVPGVPAGKGEHGLPPEPVFNMMMPDGEVPRRVEER